MRTQLLRVLYHRVKEQQHQRCELCDEDNLLLNEGDIIIINLVIIMRLYRLCF